MSTSTSLRLNQMDSSPLAFEGHGGILSQQREAELKLLTRQEWWLWFSALSVTLLSGAGFLLTAFRKFFVYSDHFYNVRSDQARWGLMCLLLLFNAWMLYRQWSFRRARKKLTKDEDLENAPANGIEDPSGTDPATGLLTRAAVEQQLGKEIARARRQDFSLTVATFHLDDFGKLTARAGKTVTDEPAKEFARRLKEASRGSDFAARIADDDFLLVLPKCTLGEVKAVLNRVGVVEIKASGHRMTLNYTTGWVDYQKGDLPSDLLRRATDILHLYKNASQEVSANLVAS